MAATSEKTRVLVVDSSPDSQEYLRAYLEESGYEVDLAATGAEGLGHARVQPPAAALIQLRLSDLSGAEVCLALRAEAKTAQATLIVIGEAGEEKKLGEVLLAGADDYVVRPFERHDLAVRLQSRLKLRASFWQPEGHEALLDLTRLLASSLDMNQLLHLVAVRTAGLLAVDRCSFLILAPDQQHATVVAASEDATLHDIEVQVANYPEFQEVIRTRRPFVVDKVEDHPALQGILPTLVAKGVGSIALFPMMHEERVDGVLFLRSERFRHSLEHRDIFFASAVAAAVALALRNMQAVANERRIAEELHQTKAFLENLIDSSVDAIMAADLEGNIMLFNKGAERIFGYKTEEVVGKLHVTNLYPGRGAQEVMDLLRREVAGGMGRLNTTRKEVLAKSGEIIPIHLTAWSVMDGDRAVATAGIFTDLRERLQIERKLSQAQEKLQKTEKQAMIAELAGATAHELNQPLTSVLGYTELAKRKLRKAEDIGRILDIILTEAERMADIVRKIGRITRYETKSYVGEQRIVDIERSSDPEEQ